MTAHQVISDLSIALRNLLRNRRHATTALLTVGMATVAMILADGFAQWIFHAMREGTIQSQLGHIQVVRPGFNQAGAADPFAYLIPRAAPERATIEKIPGIKLAAPRLAVSGLASRGETTVAFIADGIEPDREAELSKAFRITDGKNITSSDGAEVVVGRGLARALGVKPGDTLALLATTASGGVNAVEAKVVGLFISANQAYDSSALRMPIGLAQSLLRADGAHMWLILLDETENTDTVLATLRARFPQTRHRLEFVPWYERADFYNKTVALFSQQMNVLRAIIATIVVLSISNLLVMSVMERTGEIGTLLAVGFRRAKVMRLFAIEGAMLGLVGGGLGLALGFALAKLLSLIGIPMPPPPGMEEAYTAEILVTAPVMAQAYLVAFSTTTLAGLYPAWKASRLNIVNALRHNI